MIHLKTYILKVTVSHEYYPGNSYPSGFNYWQRFYVLCLSIARRAKRSACLFCELGIHLIKNNGNRSFSLITTCKSGLNNLFLTYCLSIASTTSFESVCRAIIWLG